MKFLISAALDSTVEEVIGQIYMWNEWDLNLLAGNKGN